MSNLPVDESRCDYCRQYGDKRLTSPISGRSFCVCESCWDKMMDGCRRYPEMGAWLDGILFDQSLQPEPAPVPPTPREPAPVPPTPREEFEKWTTTVQEMIAGREIDEFPYIPAIFLKCTSPYCAAAKSSGVRACVHDVAACFGAGPSDKADDARKTMYRNFHPDRFANCCVDEFREEGKLLAEEMFKLLGHILGK